MLISGIFSWPGKERRSDRYGLIFMSDKNYDGDEHSPLVLSEPELRAMAGRQVHIVATVIKTRKSSHIGDLFRGIFPSTPSVGETIDLGTGTLFIETVEDDPSIAFGLEPDDDRETDWFDPDKLYRLHDQTVSLELTIVKKETRMSFASELSDLIAKHDDAKVETIVGMLTELEQQIDLLKDRQTEREEDP